MTAGPIDADDRLIETIRAVDPYPDEVAGPPLELIMHRLHERERDPSRRPRSWLRPLAAVAPVAVAVAVAAVAVALLGHHHASGRQPASGAGTVVRACRSGLHVGVLPVWARSGFRAARPRTEFAVGRRDRIGAILFSTGNYLDSPPAADHNNKILWVSRRRSHSGGTLRIQAQLIRGTRRIGAPVRRTVPGGPGPSIINLPAAGCWRLTLRWSGLSDQLDLDYIHHG
ncbi:MAG TPA: hypothetical protein VGL69_21695 [Solirubrobacteraceae bacterium]|jgi:hypothetical protein